MNEQKTLTTTSLKKYFLGILIAILFFKTLCIILEMEPKDLLAYFLIGLEGLYIVDKFFVK